MEQRQDEFYETRREKAILLERIKRQLKAAQNSNNTAAKSV
jgi:hypothetical protein